VAKIYPLKNRKSNKMDCKAREIHRAIFHPYYP
jgi:hypothetical protein